MAVSSGPNLIEDGLVLSLDAGDINSVMGSTVEVLVVAGGGGGGMDMGGGGGGGGVIYNPSYAVTQGAAITVTVGNGGYGAPAGGAYRGDGVGPQPTSHQFTVSATQGGNSVFGSLTAIGGGFGASSYYGYLPNYGVGGTGGSGGGCSGYTHGGERYVDGTNGSTANNTAGQGFPGGNSGNATSAADDHYSGGGGGAGGRGTSGPNHIGPNGVKPNGGPGVLYPTMSPYYFAGGGGGSAFTASTGGDGGIGGGGGGAVGVTVGGAGLNNGSAGGGGNPVSQTNTPGGDAGANTGGGGGGGSHYNANNRGGNGGSGIVIVRYSGPQKATGGTISTVAGYTIHTFTSSGTFTPYLNWYDSSGNNKTFALDSSGITWNSGKYFTLADGAAILSNNAITTSTTCTVIIWIKTTDTQSLIFRGNSLGNYYLAAYYVGQGFYSNNCGSPTYWIDTNSVSNPSPTYLDGNWHMWEMKNVNFSAWTTFEFNKYPGFTFGNGAVGKIMIYNRNLSSDESLLIYNATKSRYLA